MGVLSCPGPNCHSLLIADPGPQATTVLLLGVSGTVTGAQFVLLIEYKPLLGPV